MERDGAGYGFDLGKARSKIFLQMGLDTPQISRGKLSAKIAPAE
jgi:hypothetical protein